jgi:RND family efflux transporter MFP subunit
MKPSRLILALTLTFAPGLRAQPLEVVPVISRAVERSSRLPGELLPFQQVALHARVAGFVDTVTVDRGSPVVKGQVLVTLAAPELLAQLAEAEARARAAESQRAEAEAKVAAAESTYQRLKAAAVTPGVVSGQELTLAEKALESARAARDALGDSARAARAAVEAFRDLAGYLRLIAPFDGVITERRVHPGALVGPSAPPLLELQHLHRLRLVVAVPETDVAGIVRGARVGFTVPAHPGRTFTGTVARLAQSVDPKTRTMPVELDVDNLGGGLAPGMYAEVTWPVRRPRPALLVPPSSVVTTTERTFVIRLRDGRAEWVNVSRGALAGELLEVFGALTPGDEILRRGTDEIREGTSLQVRRASPR